MQLLFVDLDRTCRFFSHEGRLRVSSSLRCVIQGGHGHYSKQGGSSIHRPMTRLGVFRRWIAAYSAASSASLKSFSLSRPTNFSATSPPLNRMTVGMALMPYFIEMSRFESVSSLPTLTR